MSEKIFKRKINALQYARKHNKKVIRGYVLKSNNLNYLIRVYQYKIM